MIVCTTLAPGAPWPWAAYTPRTDRKLATTSKLREDRHNKIVVALKAGPCELKDLAALTGMTYAQTYKKVWLLRRAKLVGRLGTEPGKGWEEKPVSFTWCGK